MSQVQPHLQLLVKRMAPGLDCTLGVMFDVTLPRRKFLCYTLEDQPNFPKVPKETRIPAGTYQIKLRTEGGMHPRYKKRFPFHVGMLWLQNVPGFQWIYIHPGNTDEDTDGCILVGDQKVQHANGEGKVLHSTRAYIRLYLKVVEELDKNHEVWITIEDFA